MTAGTKRLVLPPATNYYGIPRSSAVVEIGFEATTGKVVAHVRCGRERCYHRLFDVQEREVFAGWHPEIDVPLTETHLVIVRRCPRCRTDNEHVATTQPGTPLGESGPWVCTHCAEHGHGGYLGRFEAPRGRLVLRTCPKCRSKEPIRVTAADALDAAQRAQKRIEARAAARRVEAARRQRVAEHAAAVSAPDDDFDDVPF